MYVVDLNQNVYELTTLNKMKQFSQLQLRKLGKLLPTQHEKIGRFRYWQFEKGHGQRNNDLNNGVVCIYFTSKIAKS